jgi:hypothetical protein
MQISFAGYTQTHIKTGITMPEHFPIMTSSEHQASSVLLSTGYVDSFGRLLLYQRS